MAETNPPPTRRKFWPVMLIVLALLALTTWDIFRGASKQDSVDLRRAASAGNEAQVRRIAQVHPEWINLRGSTNKMAGLFAKLAEEAARKLGRPAVALSDDERNFHEGEALGATPLIHALVWGHVGTAKVLVELGADPRIDLNNGHSTAFFAVRSGDTNFMAALVQRGMKLDAHHPRFDLSLLHGAALDRKPEMVAFLLDRGLAVDGTNRSGDTPLSIAVGQSHLTTVQLLVSRGADPTHLDAKRKSPLDHAVTRANNSLAPDAGAVLAWLEGFVATNKPASKLVR